MRNRKKLPIGIDSFEKIIRHNFYYVDKTEMITELLHNWGEVNLFTRPRRFGKSLNMNMLQSFLEIGCDKSLFNGLKVSREKELCEEYMGKFPVISLTLKNVEGLNFESARKSLKNTLGMEAWRLSALAESSRLTEEEKNSYKALTVVDDHGDFKMSDATMEKALLILTVLLEKHYGKKAVLLIDEYDVPLDKAFQYGYYDEMVSLIRNMFGNVLKTNSSLFFAVLTGCLRIAKESIFTGLNNFNVFSITSVQFDEFFGFTDDEVAEMLKYFGLSDYHETIREWYDGYQFGKKAVYCPWDSPCDGKLSVHRISSDSRFSIKDTEYTAGQLLKNKAIAERYTGGYALIFRLTVDDYHHYCYVADGRKSANVTLPGVFHTVNPAANDVYPIYKENAREYTLLKTKQFGTILMMEVGAMMVGKITNLHKNPATVKKGQEKGNFEFGGSTIILLIQPGKVRIDYDLIENTEEGYETIVKMGERIGECRKLKNTKNHYEGIIKNA